MCVDKAGQNELSISQFSDDDTEMTAKGSPELRNSPVYYMLYVARVYVLFDPSNVERVQDEVDVCIVGGGPAGISAAIRLKQLEQEKGKELRGR